MRVAPETILFLYACLLGAALGVFYDLFRMLRMVTGGNAVLVFAEDLVFALAAAGVTFWFCLASCHGWLRGFVLAGEGLGFLLYHFTVGELVIRLFALLLRAVKWVLRGVWLWILSPPLRAVMFVLHKIFSRISHRLQKLGKIRFSHNFSLQLPWRMLYNKHNKQVDSGKGGSEIHENEKE